VESSYSQYDFDYYQADSSVEPLAIGFYLPLADVYAFDPAPADLADSNHAEYMAFLRVAALSEMVWSHQASRSYADFQARLPAHLERLDVLGVNYRPLGNDDQTLSGQFQTFLMRTAMSFYFWLIQP
jgi:hypothetical protein